MKISNEQVNRANAVDPIAPTHAHPQPSQTPAATAAVAGSSPAVKVDLSEQAKALSAARSEAAGYLPAVKAAPETRTALVATLKAQVQSGTYHVSSADIAEKIIRHAQDENISKQR